MGRSYHSGKYATPKDPSNRRNGARNIYGEESEQSKERRGLKSKADPLAGEGSLSAKLKAGRKRKRRLLERK